MGACATKSGDLKVKGEAPLAVEDAAAPPVAGDEKAKAKADGVPVPVAAEIDQADVSRRRSLSVLLKQDAEASDGEAADQEEEKVVAGESASAAGDAGETVGSPQAPVQASVAAEQDDTAGEVLKDGSSGDGDAQASEEEKRVDPESVQVAVAVTDAAATPSSEESKVADDDASA